MTDAAPSGCPAIAGHHRDPRVPVPVISLGVRAVSRVYVYAGHSPALVGVLR